MREWVEELKSRLRALLRRRQLECDLEDEITFHLAMREAQLRDSGVPDAPGESVRQFGNVSRIKNDCRDLWTFTVIDRWWTDVRSTTRFLIRTPGFTLAVLLMLVLGIGLNVAAFSLLNATLLKPLPIPSAVRVASVQVTAALANVTGTQATPNHFAAWRSDRQLVEVVAATVASRVQISVGGEVEEVQVRQVSLDFHQLAGMYSRIGRVFLAEDFIDGARSSCVISSRLWRRQFSQDPRIIGRTLNINGAPTVIIGVAASAFSFPDGEADVWTPLAVTANQGNRKNLDVYVRLAPGVTIRQAEQSFAELTVEGERSLPEWLRTKTVRLIPIRQLIVAKEKDLLFLLNGIAACVFVICCANIANLFLARHLSRRRELAIRSAIGATRFRLARLFLLESLMVGFTGAMAGLLAGRGLYFVAVRLFYDSRLNALVFQDEHFTDGRVLLFTGGLTVLATLIFGLLPIAHIDRSNLSLSLKAVPGAEIPGMRGAVSRRCLITIELAVAFVLISGAGLLARSFAGLLAVDRGYDVSHLLTARVPPPAGEPVTVAKRKEFFRQVQDKLESLPTVQTVGVVTGLPLGGLNASVTLQRPGEQVDPANLPWAAINVVNHKYFSAMRIPILQGRGFVREDNATAQRVAIVNATLARQFWTNDAVGEELVPGIRVVGVVKDVAQEGLDTRQGPAFYVPFEQRESLSAAPTFVLVRVSGDPEAFIPALRQTITYINPHQPVLDVRTMEQVMYRSVQRRQLLTWASTGFALLAVAIAMTGVYGVLSYVVGHRTREIGIRICLGAGRVEIVLLVFREIGIITIGAMTLGSLGAWASTRLLTEWLFGIAATDPVTVVTTATLTVMVALLGATVPVIRALHVDPLVAVRSD